MRPTWSRPLVTSVYTSERQRVSARPTPCSTRATGAKTRGTDVVIGFVESHGRPLTQELCNDLETIPRQVIEYRGTSFEEMDLDAVIARHPKVALVDELAHTNVPGSATPNAGRTSSKSSAQEST